MLVPTFVYIGESRGQLNKSLRLLSGAAIFPFKQLLIYAHEAQWTPTRTIATQKIWWYREANPESQWVKLRLRNRKAGGAKSYNNITMGNNQEVLGAQRIVALGREKTLPEEKCYWSLQYGHTGTRDWEDVYRQEHNAEISAHISEGDATENLRGRYEKGPTAECQPGARKTKVVKRKEQRACVVKQQHTPSRCAQSRRRTTASHPVSLRLGLDMWPGSLLVQLGSWTWQKVQTVSICQVSVR
jgi:hypothetical protein